jgi:hypothetical protein
MNIIELDQCTLDNPDLPRAFIQEILLSKHTAQALAEPFVFEVE